MIYYLSLGSNLGNRKKNLERAVSFLKGIGKILKVSSIYETDPVSMEESSGKFLNIVLSIEYSKKPYELLIKIKEFEKKMGRDIKYSHNKPRKIDIDILIAGNHSISTEILTVPHKKMTERAFVMIPLNEIAPDLIHPVRKISVRKISGNLEDQKKVVKLGDFPFLTNQKK